MSRTREKSCDILIKFSDTCAGVYAIVDAANGYEYIGSSRDISKRIQTHAQSLRVGNHSNRNLQKAYSDGHPLTAVILESVPQNCARYDLLNKEASYVSSRPRVYNIAHVFIQKKPNVQEEYERFRKRFKQTLCSANNFFAWFDRCWRAIDGSETPAQTPKQRAAELAKMVIEEFLREEDKR